jgi:membrane associated rhomboid family serine protease
MNYIVKRVVLLILIVIAFYYISDYIQETAVVEPGDFNFEGVIAFFRMSLILVIVSLAIFGYEAYIFHKQGRKKERNVSLGLIISIVLLIAIFAGFFLQFVV